jgi:hypothetical protein
MAQGDYLIQNQSFPSFRSDLNDTLEAINTSNSGTSRPTSAVAGTVWLDVTNATNPTLKFFDGTDDISLAQLDYSANTVNWLDSTVSADLLNDTTPQLGGNLDVNGNSIVSVSNGNITFTPDGTGKVIIDGLSHPTADGTSGQFMKTDGAGNLSFDTVDLTNLSATNLTSGTVPIARLGTSGTKDATTFLRGDNTFATAGGGDMVLLNTATGSNVSSIDINGYFTSDYDHYKLVYSVYAATNNTDTMVRIMQSGSVITASNYRFAGHAWYYDGTYSQSSNAVGWNTNYIGIASTDNTSNSQYPTTGEMLLSNPLSITQNTTITTNSIGYNSDATPSAIRTWNYAGTYVSLTATSGISFGYIGGNIHGTIRLYGLKNS